MISTPPRACIPASPPPANTLSVPTAAASWSSHPSGLNTTQYAISVGNFNTTIAQTIHFVQFDNTNANQNQRSEGAGIGKRQTASAFSPTTLQQTFVFGMQGETPCNNYNSTNPSCANSFYNFGAVNTAGTFTGSSGGTIASGEEDFNVQGGYSSAAVSLNGGFDAPNPVNGRGTLSLQPVAAVSMFYGPPVDYVYYVVNSGEIFLLSADAHDGYTLLSGDALLQSGAPFSNATLSGNYIFSFQEGTGGDGLSIYPATTQAGIYRGAVDSGHTTFTLNGDENDGGNVKLNQSPGTASYLVYTSGRMIVAGPGLVIYLANSTQGFGLTEPTGPDDGAALLNFQQQSPLTFSNSAINGTYAFGSAPPVVFNTNNSGVLNSTGNGTANVTIDTAQQSGILAADQPQRLHLLG